MTESSLRKEMASGFQWTGLASGVSALIQAGLLLVFIRALSPEDFGLYSLVLVVAGFSQAFGDMGITNAIVYKRSATDIELSSVFWLGLLVGVGLFLTTFASAGALAGFYGEPRLQGYVRWIALSFLIHPWGQFFFALLQRDMAFPAIAKIEIVARTSQLLSTLVLLGLGYGIHAFVWGTLIGVFVQALLFGARGRRIFTPSRRFVPGEARDLATFGLFQMGERITNYFAYQIDILLIGRLLGAQSLGLYNAAKQITLKPSQLFNPIVTKVVYPVLSKYKGDPPRFTRIFREAVHFTAFVNLPVCALLFVFADDIATVVLGGEWVAAGTLLRILSVYAAIRAFQNPSGILALARGKAHWGFAYAVAQVLLIPPVIFAASSTSIVGVSLAQVGLVTLLLIPNWSIFVRRLTDDTFRSFHRGPARVLLASILAALATTALLGILPGPVLRLTVGGGAFIGLAAVLLRLLDHPMWTTVTETVRERLRTLRARSSRA